MTGVGRRSFLAEGVSCTGKASVCHELRRRGFDAVFVLEVDTATLARRLDARSADEFGGTPEERALVERVHRTGEDTPDGGIRIDASAPLPDVVDEILRHAREVDARPG